MACPVCDHTMQNMGVEHRRVFWCPRCGSLKEEIVEGSHVEPTMFMRQIIKASQIGGVPGISYHSVIPVRFVVEKPGNGQMKLSLLEICR